MGGGFMSQGGSGGTLSQGGSGGTFSQGGMGVERGGTIAIARGDMGGQGFTISRATDAGMRGDVSRGYVRGGAGGQTGGSTQGSGATDPGLQGGAGGAATSTSDAVPAVSVSTSAVTASGPDAAAQVGAGDASAPSGPNSFFGGRVRGGARAHFSRSMGGRAGRTAAGGSMEGLGGFSSEPTQQQGRMMNRARRR
jgi:hypothetical protein